MELTQLSKIGLTKGEIKIYLALIKHGAQSKSPLSSKAEVSSSKVYEITEKLIKKGLAGSFKKNNATYYTATDPKFLIEYIEKKEKELQEEKKVVNKLLPKLQALKRESKEEISFEVYEGWKGTENILWETLEETPEGSVLTGIGMKYPSLSFQKKYHDEVKRKNINLEVIFTTKNLVKSDYKHAKIKYLPDFGKIGMGIYPDRVIIMALDKKILTLVIKHPRIRGAFKKIYDYLWKQAKS